MNVMKIHYQVSNFNEKPELTEYADKKFSKLNQYNGDITEIKVTFKLLNTTDKINKSTELLILLPKEELVIKKNGTSFEECIDLAYDAAKNAAIKQKEKHNDH